MNSFHTVAVPHKDILEGRLTMDVFAADLGDVFNKRGTDEYKNADTFFDKTYLTEGLDNLLSIVQQRLDGKGGDPVIQLQTPFGGGKTHALIAMYHRAHSWNTKTAVAVGTALSTEQTLWGLLEHQLTGQTTKLTGQVAPGKDALRPLLEQNQPLLILMDEILEYVTRAAGVKVGETTLAAQTIAFMHEFTELVSSLEKVALVITLPSSVLEHYDQSAELLYQRLQKVTGRVEKIYTPVQDFEITKIIRKRLFSQIDHENIDKIVKQFVNYAENEDILPENTQPSEYRHQFTESYPFLPEVVDVLYHRWGSYPEFQRTRGVLRLLSLIIHHARETDKPYISLSDFDLRHQNLRQELLKHIGQEFNSVIDMDVAGKNPNAKKIDISLRDAYKGLKLGSRTAAAIFLYSFSGGHEQGADLKDIKRTATTLQNPSAIISEVVNQLENKLFYLQSAAGKYYFSSQANLNRILITEKSNIHEYQLNELQYELLRKNIQGQTFKTYLWENDPSQIADTEELKLIILENEDKTAMQEILTQKGQTPRVYRNTILFLYPLEIEKINLEETLRQKIAYTNIDKATHLKLSPEQTQTVKNQLKNLQLSLNQSIHRSYRIVALPARDGIKKIDLGVPTYASTSPLDLEIYQRMRKESEILETIAPIVIKEKYLFRKEYVFTEQLYFSSLKTPGETRFVNRTGLENAIMEGVRKGIFGLGEIENNQPICRYFNEDCTIAFSGSEIIIREQICSRQKKEEEYPPLKSGVSIVHEPGAGYQAEPPAEPPQYKDIKERLRLKFQIPKGKVSNMMGILNFIQSKFQVLEIELSASDGSLTRQDYEDKILEAFSQSGIELKEE
ncbi:MAG: ATP-binding protein [bacterium]|nr:ATP-binding protein [bacterium]